MSVAGTWRCVFLLLAFVAPTRASTANDLVAVAIRYLQIEGVSHSHIYLYDLRGHLVRRLTSGNSGQDIQPVFSPDGGQVVFTRRLNTGDELWIVSVSGNEPRKLTQPPPWYEKIRGNAPRFVLLSLDWERYYERLTSASPDASPEPTPNELHEPNRIIAPDNSVELILDRTGDDTRDYNNGERGALYRVRNPATGEESLLRSWQNFQTMWDPLHLRGEEQRFFLIEPPLRTIFFFRHLNSTDGSTVYALDFNHKRVVQLSQNYATPIPIPGEAKFFAVAEERYRPLGDGKRTVNCSYLDLWNAQFEKKRFGRNVPAIFNGGCLFRSGNGPLTIAEM